MVCSTFTEDIVCSAASRCCWEPAFAEAPGHEGTCGECVRPFAAATTTAGAPTAASGQRDKAQDGPVVVDVDVKIDLSATDATGDADIR